MKTRPLFDENAFNALSTGTWGGGGGEEPGGVYGVLEGGGARGPLRSYENLTFVTPAYAKCIPHNWGFQPAIPAILSDFGRNPDCNAEP